MMVWELKTRKTGEGAFPDANSFISYSLNFEDVILHRLFPVTQTGFYVDVGAGHPRFENDTFSFYQRGWRGINIEPNHGFHCALMKERPRDINLQVVLSDSSGGALTYYELNGSGLSTCDVEQATAYQAAGRAIVLREVPVTTLSSILTEAGIDHINILKVDVGGFEEKVLNGNDWDKFRPDVVVVEAIHPERPIRRPTKILSFMEQRGYRHVYFDGLNDFYLEREFPAPEGLTLPPNVFDRFVPREIVDLRDEVESLRTKFTPAEQYASPLKTQLDEALHAADALAVENRRVGHQTAHLAYENRRLRAAAEQMRAELLRLNQLLEPLHAIGEQMERQRRQERELAGLKNQLVVANEELAGLKNQLVAADEERAGLKNQLIAANEKLPGVKNQLIAADEELAGVRNQLAAANEELAGLKNQLIAANKELAGLKNQLIAANKELLGVKNQLIAADEERAGLKNQLIAANKELLGVKNQLIAADEERAGLKNQLVATDARLASAYSSRCWRLTAPLRWCDDIQRRLVRRIRKGNGG
jgi:FkbM family methyltransferase